MNHRNSPNPVPVAHIRPGTARAPGEPEVGTDPTLVARWTAEVNAARAAAEAQLRAITGTTTARMTAEQIKDLITSLGTLLAVLRDADPADKAEIYRGLGLQLTYHPARNTMIAEAKPSAIMYEGPCPRGDLVPDR